jgi:ABC transporter, ATP-binding protein
MNEAARCDRISFMHKGRVLAVGTPAELAARQNAPDLEEAFVQYLIEAESDNGHSEQGSLGQDPTIPSDSASWVSTQPTAKAADISDDLYEQNARSSESEQSEFRKNTDGVYFEQGRLGQDPTALSWVSTQHTATEFSDDLQGKDTGSSETQNDVREPSSHTLRDNPNTQNFKYRFSMIWTFARREAKELLRDKIRLFFAVFGPLIIMASVSWGISFDVRNLKFAVYDRDQTAASRELVEYFDGSRYFLQQPPIQSEAEIDTVLKSSGAILVIDIPSGFGRDLARGLKPEVGFYVDGSMPFNATNIRGYIGSLITAYTKDRIAESGLPVSLKAPAGIEPRFMYNQDFDSINAIAPGVMMLVLMMIPAMMSAVGVVREREIGSIANFYASPAAVAQYLIGKQLPYIAVGMVNFAAMMLMIIYLFGVPLKGSFTGLAVGTLLMVSASTALGLLISCFVRSQLAAIFATAIITMIPAQTYSGFLYPLSTMEGGALVIGKTFPSSWYYTVSVGSFTKGLHTADLLHEYAAIAAFAATSLILACVLLKKQEK